MQQDRFDRQGLFLSTERSKTTETMFCIQILHWKQMMLAFDSQFHLYILNHAPTFPSMQEPEHSYANAFCDKQ